MIINKKNIPLFMFILALIVLFLIFAWRLLSEHSLTHTHGAIWKPFEGIHFGLKRGSADAAIWSDGDQPYQGSLVSLSTGDTSISGWSYIWIYWRHIRTENGLNIWSFVFSMYYLPIFIGIIALISKIVCRKTEKK